jgi:hypothetical protein
MKQHGPMGRPYLTGSNINGSYAKGSAVDEPRLLSLDIYSAQKTPAIKEIFANQHVQVLDVSVNKIFKNRIKHLADIHFTNNPEDWNTSVSRRRIIITHWVGEAYIWLHEKQKDLIIKTFQQVGLALPIDGSQDDIIKVKDVPDLRIGDWRRRNDDGTLYEKEKHEDYYNPYDGSQHVKLEGDDEISQQPSTYVIDHALITEPIVIGEDVADLDMDDFENDDWDCPDFELE